MKTMQKIIVTVILVLGSTSLLASNLQITRGPEIIGVTADRVIVEFDMSWENSWRLNHPNNWDAAWVFMKYRIDAQNFKHANLHATAGIATRPGNTPNIVEYGTSRRPDGTEVNVGVFIYRSQDHTWGDMVLNQVRLNWDIRGTGITEETVLSVRVFAIEMVYVPEGAFQIGDEWSYDYFVMWGDTLMNSTFTPWAGTAAAANSFTNQPNLIPRFTSNTTVETGATGFVASASNINGVNVPWFAFDRNVSSGSHWHTTQVETWHWLQVEIPSPVRATWGIFSTHSAAMGNYGIRGFYIDGSNDGVGWTRIHGDREYVYPSTTVYKFGRNNFTNIPIAFDQPGNYRFYRFHFYAPFVVVYDIQLFGAGEERINRITSESQPSVYFAGLNNAAYPAINTTPALPANLQPIAPGFPKGFQAFYVMKHEVTQAAWVDFLNCLTWDQQHRIASNPGAAPNAALNNITPFSVVGTNLLQPWYGANTTNGGAGALHRMNIRIRERGMDGPAVFGVGQWVTTSVEQEDEEGNMVMVPWSGWHWDHEIHGGNIPMFNLAWTDITAYLDWAGLRPMTELEYEKAARGNQPRVREEYAWGQPFLPSRAASVTDRNLPTEAPLPLVANYAHVDPAAAAHTAAIAAYWPVRAGSFARETTTRAEAGASFWGILNLSDNVPERVITVSTAQGRAFTGEHGDGEITAMGFSNVPNWPSQDVAIGSNNRLALGTGYRGIAVSNATQIQFIQPVSSRVGAEAPVTGTWPEVSQNNRDLWTGARGVRTAPKP